MRRQGEPPNGGNVTGECSSRNNPQVTKISNTVKTSKGGGKSDHFGGNAPQEWQKSKQSEDTDKHNHPVAQSLDSGNES